MPELPEVDALRAFLGSRAVGQAVVGVELGSFTVLKTVSPPPQALIGAPVESVTRHGKFLDVDVDDWDKVMAVNLRGVFIGPLWGKHEPYHSPIAVRVRLSDDSGFDLTEAGTKKRLAAYIVSDPMAVPGIASLGPDPLGMDFTEERFAAILAGRRAQIKGVLRDQGIIGGIGNAYSDEILHVAKMSPFAMAASLDADAVARLYEAMRETLTGAVATASGKPAAELKDAKRAGMRVHGRTGEVCPECGDVVREVSFADSSLQYCATCQTGGKPLADRRTSKFLK